jgi:hypothetical protein
VLTSVQKNCVSRPQKQYYIEETVLLIDTKAQWPYSQNLFSQIRKFFVTLGINVFRFLRLKVFFF